MATQGTATLDFGAFPGASDASVTVTGQASILSGSLVEAWLYPSDTADHTADEHMLETIKIVAGNIAAGTGFTIYGFNTNQISEPLEENRGLQNANSTAAQFVAAQKHLVGGRGTRIYGQWTVAWVWN